MNHHHHHSPTNRLTEYEKIQTKQTEINEYWTFSENYAKLSLQQIRIQYRQTNKIYNDILHA